MKTEQEIEEDLNNAKATIEMEGLNPSKEAIDICRRYAKGEISEHEAENMILKLHGINPCDGYESVTIDNVEISM